ncbi:hypothetical protein [Bradyrhizobium denitrificans]|jgi:hypothetical protein|uniref:hypothetical protein n=1 Tax=Bradyrhizobium denitrificans TaxID=2734912 RepID=UPI0015516C57|nr:hypothetical protein [Bradyrhizobium sp. LMG 8443]NPU23938.1 hypothetical protein [Bradyrhizobium sp. LMG 8443]
MNTGTDYTLSFYDGGSGLLVPLGDVQNVKITALKHSIKSQPFNRPPRYGFVPDGYKIDFQITRTGSELTDFLVAVEQNFNEGRVLRPGYFNETINNPNGSLSRYQYTEFVIFLDDHGNIQRDAPVTLTLEGMASSKVPIA